MMPIIGIKEEDHKNSRLNRFYAQTVHLWIGILNFVGQNHFGQKY